VSRVGVTLPDPERCRHCGKKGRVIESRREPGYRRRRHQCDACNWRWSSYQSIINPSKVKIRRPTDTTQIAPEKNPLT
jgi:transcriptional regulator NrdR family protein